MKAPFGARGSVLKACVAGVLLALASSPTHSQVSVLTQKNDTSRTGQNISETVLNTSNVNTSQFGRLFNIAVDGCLYAQPLYVPNVSIGGGTHNVVYLATAHDSVYACDADTGTQYWKVSLGVPVPSSVINTPNIPIEVGIIGTPAIDTSTNTVYVDAKTYPNSVQTHSLHALDITTGAEKFGGPVVISASVPGTGEASVNGVVPFQASQENQRPGITLANGNVYVAFASHEDYEPYHGWILSYNKSTLQQNAVFNDTPNGIMGGIWMAGQGLVVDSSGNIYCMTGNGSSDVQSGGSDYAECFMKLSPTLSVLDWFMPSDEADLNAGDEDLGSAGPMMIPGTSDLVGGGKAGILYLVNSGNMGHFNSSTDQVLQEWQAINTSLSGTHHIHCAPVYYNNNIYVWGENDYLRDFSFNGTSFNTTATTGIDLSPASNSGMPGGMLSVSANGNTAGTGIVWATTPLNADSLHAEVSGIFRAYSASNVSTELWNSLQNGPRDDIGLFAKDNSPTVANGKVYVGSFSGYLSVYGVIANGSCNVNTGTPTGLAASATNSTSTVLNWSALTPPSGCSINSYTVYQNGTALGYTNATTMTVGSLASSTTYTFTVAATDAHGTSAQSAPVSVTTLPSGSAPLANGAYKFVCEDGGFTIDDPNGGGAGIGVDQEAYAGTDQQWNLTIVSGTQYKITNVATGLALTGASASAQLTVAAYTGATNQLWTFAQTGGYYIVTNVSSGQVIDDFNNSVTSGTPVGQWGANAGTNQAWTVTTIASSSCTTSPSPPTGLTAVGTSSSATTLNWVAVNPPANCSVTSYTVFENGTAVASTTSGTTCFVSGLAASTTYTFTVSAVDSHGTGSQSGSINVTTASGTAPLANGTYKIISEVGGLAVDDLNGGGAGTGVDQQAYAGTDQQWALATVTGNEYKITNVATGLALTAPTTNAQLTVTPYIGAADQLWTFTANGGYYLATNVSTGQVLDNFGGSVTAGTVIGQWGENNGTNQNWTMTLLSTTCSTTPNAPATPTASSTISTGTGLSWTAVTPPANCTISSYEIYENGTALANTTGATYYVTGLAAGTTYKFTVAAVDSDGTGAQSAAVSVTTSPATAPFANGTYKIVCEMSGFAVDDPSGGGAGTGVDQQTYSGTDQQWVLTLVSGIEYKLVNVASGLALTGASGSAQLTVAAYTGATNQLWTFAQSGTYYAATNVSTGQLLDDFNNSVTAGTPVGQWGANGGTNQFWTVTAISASCAATPGAPATPTASNTTSTGTSLSWSAVTPPANCTISSYEVFQNGTALANTTSTGYAVTGLTPSTAYTFTVAAVDSDGTGAKSSGVNVTTSSGSICTGVAAWSANSVSYVPGNLVTYNGSEYKCIQANTSQAGWDPPAVPALFSLVGSC